jgi:hypothetical protein
MACSAPTELLPLLIIKVSERVEASSLSKIMVYILLRIEPYGAERA